MIPSLARLDYSFKQQIEPDQRKKKNITLLGLSLINSKEEETIYVPILHDGIVKIGRFSDEFSIFLTSQSSTLMHEDNQFNPVYMMLLME